MPEIQNTLFVCGKKPRPEHHVRPAFLDRPEDKPRPASWREEPPTLTCETCRLVYEVRDGIPILLIDEARPLENA